MNRFLLRRLAFHLSALFGALAFTCLVLLGLLISLIGRYSKDLNEVAACMHLIAIFAFGAVLCAIESIGALLYWRGVL